MKQDRNKGDESYVSAAEWRTNREQFLTNSLSYYQLTGQVSA